MRFYIEFQTFKEQTQFEKDVNLKSLEGFSIDAAVLETLKRYVDNGYMWEPDPL